MNYAHHGRGVSPERLRSLYKGMLLPRMIEEKMLILLRQGRISKWFSGIGQEAIAVGATQAMLSEEYILPMHRNLGVFTSRGMDLATLFRQLQGKDGGFSQGRERSFHFGSNPHHIVGMISHLGPQLAVADGIGLADKLSGLQQATLVFTGDGGTSEGDFHEALNVASVWDLPVIFLIENNCWGLSTPSKEQYRCAHLVERALGYGMKGVRINGNNVLDVYQTIDRLASEIRKDPKPVLVECDTFRMRGHEEASGTKYYPDGLIDAWAEQDPIANFEAYLLSEDIISDAEVDGWKAENKERINEALEEAFATPQVTFKAEKELGEVYAPHQPEPKEAGSETKNIRFVDAVSEGLREGMRAFPDSVIMGQDIAEYGGVFKITEGFLEEFGKERVRNTPICESAILSAALGLSVRGYKAIVEMQFADFVTSGFNPIVNNLAKSHYRWGQNADVVVRMPTGAGVGAGPFHSQSNEAWFTHTPGLKVVYPSNPADAKGLLLASIEDPNPVMFFEHKALYRSQYGEVPAGYYTTPIGKSIRVVKGNQISVITYGMGVEWTKEFMKAHPEISIDLVDLRTLLPLDEETILESVKATGKVLVLHEDTAFGGLGGEISSIISEKAFEHLDAPVKRLGSLNMPVPFAKPLEDGFLASSRIEETLLDLHSY